MIGLCPVLKWERRVGKSRLFILIDKAYDIRGEKLGIKEEV
jgi:hypothetical protein